MNEQEMYPVCTILYKTDSSDGWHYAIMSGDEEVCKIECEKLKQENNWLDYKCYVSVRYVDKQDIPFQNHSPWADYLHRCTSLIYSPFDKKFYYPEENMPCDLKDEILPFAFEIIVKGEGEDDENIWEPTDIEDFESGTDITISFCDNKDKIIAIADNLVKDIPNFLQRLKNTKYANIIIEEYTYAKFLAWEVGSVVKFIVQDYSEYKIETIIDKVIDKEVFYQEFEKFYDKTKMYIEKHWQSYEKFKQQHNL